jgi:hypothetical protein
MTDLVERAARVTADIRACCGFDSPNQYCAERRNASAGNRLALPFAL